MPRIPSRLSLIRALFAARDRILTTGSLTNLPGLVRLRLLRHAHALGKLLRRLRK